MKTIAIHQPNYLPWLGFFYKISKVDEFVLLDHVDIVTGSASAITNRTRLKGSDGAIILTIPIKRGAKIINKVEIDYQQNWPRKHLNSINLLYHKSPFFDCYFPELRKTLEGRPKYISELNISLIKLCCSWLDIHTPLIMSSDLNHLDIHKSELLIQICKLLKADAYLSGNGARKYNDEFLFNKAGIGLIYSSFKSFNYLQRFGDFVPGLSAMDLLFNLGPDAKTFLNDQ